MREKGKRKKPIKLCLAKANNKVKAEIFEDDKRETWENSQYTRYMYLYVFTCIRRRRQC